MGRMNGFERRSLKRKKGGPLWAREARWAWRCEKGGDWTGHAPVQANVAPVAVAVLALTPLPSQIGCAFARAHADSGGGARVSAESGQGDGANLGAQAAVSIFGKAREIDEIHRTIESMRKGGVRPMDARR
eukprot:5990927-Pleurochrysis_carterae.AAC.1